MPPKYFESSNEAHRNRSIEIGRHITPPAHLAAKMKPFNFAVHNGVKHDHLWAFFYVCNAFDGYQLKTGQKATRYALLYHVLMTKKTERPKKFAQRAV